MTPDRIPVERLDEQAEELRATRRALVRDRSERRRTWLILGAASVVGVILIWIGLGVRSNVSAQKANTERSDCAREISNEQTAVKDRRDALRDRITEAYARNSLGLPQTEDLFVLLGEFTKARQAVAKLQPTQVLVDARCPTP